MIQATNQVVDAMAAMATGQKSQAVSGQEIDFRTLLDTALQGDTSQIEAPRGGKNGQTPAEKSTEKKPQAADNQSGESAQQMAAVAQVEVQPAEELQQTVSGELSGQMLQAVAQAPELGQLTQLQEPPVQQILTEDAAAQLTQEQLDMVVSMGQVQQPAEQIQQPTVMAVVPQEIVPPEQAQERFDHLLAQAAEELEELAATEPPVTEESEEPVLPAVPELPEAELPEETEEQPVVKVPEELRPELPDEPVEKQDQPAVIRALEKNVRSSAQEDKPEEPLLAVLDARTPPARETVEVKPLERTPDPQPAPAEQIKSQVIEHLEQEKMEFRMQLQPQELGRVDVKLVLESGRLTVEIMAASAKTAELLTRQTEGLAASLRIGNVDLQSVQVVTATSNDNTHMEQSLNMMMGDSNPSEQQGDERTGGGRPGGAGEATGADLFADEPQPEPQTLMDYSV